MAKSKKADDGTAQKPVKRKRVEKVAQPAPPVTPPPPPPPPPTPPPIIHGSPKKWRGPACGTKPPYASIGVYPGREERWKDVTCSECLKRKPGGPMADKIEQFSGEYEFLSNFYASPLTVDGFVYPTLEHAFQASKTANPTERELVRTAPTPGQAKARGRKVTLIPSWDTKRVEVMRRLLEIKFSDKVLRAELLATEDRELIEGNYWNDQFWGVYKGSGQNMLGKLLMEVRAKLRTAPPAVEPRKALPPAPKPTTPAPAAKAEAAPAAKTSPAAPPMDQLVESIADHTAATVKDFVTLKPLPASSKISSGLAFQQVAFADLPELFKVAVQKCGMAGAADKIIRRFSATEVSLEAIADELFAKRRDVRDRYESFDDYHAWWMRSVKTLQWMQEVPDSVWPIILHARPGEAPPNSTVILDGLHRFHWYVHHFGLDKVVPVIWRVE